MPILRQQCYKMLAGILLKHGRLLTDAKKKKNPKMLGCGVACCTTEMCLVECSEQICSHRAMMMLLLCGSLWGKNE